MTNKNILLFLATLFSLNIATQPLNAAKVVQDPVKMTEKRKELTREYSKFHYGIDDYALNDPQAIIIHATATPTYRSTHNSFYGETLEGRQDIKDGGKVNTGAHYVIDRDGTIYQQMPLNVMCRHAIGYNYTAIGIENVSTPDSLMTDAQIKADAYLIDSLEKEMPSIKFVFAHKDYAKAPQSQLIRAIGNPKYTPKNKPKQDPYGNDFEKIMKALNGLPIN